MVVSKEVKRLREYEQALLRAYQALLKALLEVCVCVCVMCVCVWRGVRGCRRVQWV